MSIFGKIIKYLQDEGLFGEGGGKRKLEGWYDTALKVFCAVYSSLFSLHHLLRARLPGDPRGLLLPGDLRHQLRPLQIRSAISPGQAEHLRFPVHARHDGNHRLLHRRVPHSRRTDGERGQHDRCRPRLGDHPPLARDGPEDRREYHPDDRGRAPHLRLFRPLLPPGAGPCGFLACPDRREPLPLRGRDPGDDDQHLRLLHPDLRHPGGLHGGVGLRQGLRRSRLRHHRPGDRRAGPGLGHHERPVRDRLGKRRGQRGRRRRLHDPPDEADGLQAPFRRRRGGRHVDGRPVDAAGHGGRGLPPGGDLGDPLHHGDQDRRDPGDPLLRIGGGHHPPRSGQTEPAGAARLGAPEVRQRPPGAPPAPSRSRS